MAADVYGPGEFTHSYYVRFFLTMEEVLFLRRVAQLRNVFVRKK